MSFTYISVIESQEFLLVCFISLKFLFKGNWVTAFNDVVGSTVNTMTVLWHEWINVNSVFLVVNSFAIVDSATVSAGKLVLFDVDEDIIWEADVNESIETTFVGLEGFSFSNIAGEVGENKAVLGLSTESQ